MEDMKNVKSRPLVPVRAIWEKNSISKYPETIRVPMEDGHVISYRIDVEQPHPCFLEAMDLIRSMKEGGYQYKEKHRIL